MSTSQQRITNPISGEEYEVVTERPKTAQFEFGYCGVSYFHMPSGRRIATVQS